MNAGYVGVIFLIARLTLATSVSELTWATDYQAVLKVAQESKRPILAQFSGSDWCPNCVRLQNEVFDTDEFKTWAAEKVILLELDFPRAPTQSPELKKQNRELLQKFSIQRYPTMVMIDQDGKELGRTFYVEGGAKPWIESAEKALKGEVASKTEGTDGTAAGSEQHGDWLVSWDQALAESKKTKKPIFADFTGSDWCPWCIKLREEVFDTPQFRAWARKNVVLLEVDFPKHKELSEELKKQNAKLRDSNNVSGLPTVVFFDARGKKAGQLGYEPGGAEKWIKKADSLVKKARGG
jgi:protein disulfide-isomerase